MYKNCYPNDLHGNIRDITPIGKKNDKYCLYIYLIWLTHSKSLGVDTPSSNILTTTSLACTSITIKADIVIRPILVKSVLTNSLRSSNWDRSTLNNSGKQLLATASDTSSVQYVWQTHITTCAGHFSTHSVLGIWKS